MIKCSGTTKEDCVPHLLDFYFIHVGVPLKHCSPLFHSLGGRHIDVRQPQIPVLINSL